MNPPTRDEQIAPTPVDLNGWHDPVRRVKRLQVAQGVVLAFACVASVVVAVFLARALVHSADRQEAAYVQLRELSDIRTLMRKQEVDLVKRVAAGQSPVTVGFYADYSRFRQTALRLNTAGAGGDGPDAVSARAEVLGAIEEVDRASRIALAHPEQAIDIANRLQERGGAASHLANGMDRWLQAATVRVTAVVAESREVSGTLLRLLVGVVGAVGLGGLMLWLGLDRARTRLVGTLQSSEARFRSLVQHSSDTVMIIDADGVITYASEPARELCGYRPEALIGRPLHELVDPTDGSRMAMLANMGVLALQADQSIEWRLRHRDGSTRYVETISSAHIDDGAIGGLVLNSRDITERRVVEQELEHRAFHDVLTNLANRALFSDRANHALTLAGRDGSMVAVMVLDLDDFKTVNDSLGHGAGDMLLVEAANRLRATLRSTDTAARLGGDEFALLIERARDLDEVAELAERVMAALREPIRIGGRDLVMRASLGIATSMDGAATATSLLRDADVAMYVAKGRRQAGWAVFDPSMAEAASERLGLISALNGALERDEISLVYQPVVNMETGAIAGAEALMRWSTPEHGSVPPTVFIPIAEDTGLITVLGAWALKEAVRAAAGWAASGLDHLVLSVNVSTRQLEHPAFATLVGRTLEEAGFPAHRLTLEVTESAAMHDSQATLMQLAAVSALGVRVAIDDFGTGYSSLAYLARLPIDIVKIDRAFVAGLSVGKRDARLASMIVSIGQSLDLTTVAEGVEDANQVADLLELGCRLGQGYHFARPMSAPDLEEYVRASAASHA